MTQAPVREQTEPEATASSRVVYERKPDRTASRSTVLAGNYAFLRDSVRFLNEDLTRGHREAQGFDLDERSKLKDKKSVNALLDELSLHRSMAWRDLARLVGVSVSAVRKWRHKGQPSPERRSALARLAAFLDILEDFMVEEPVAWLGLPVVDGYTIRHMDLYEAGRLELLLDLAGNRISGKDALRQFNEDWRDRYRSDFEVFEAGDGQPAIRRRAN